MVKVYFENGIFAICMVNKKVVAKHFQCTHKSVASWNDEITRKIYDLVYCMQIESNKFADAETKIEGN
jgi:hypothetical protein